jgi:hypothetical protein
VGSTICVKEWTRIRAPSVTLVHLSWFALRMQTFSMYQKLFVPCRCCNTKSQGKFVVLTLHVEDLWLLCYYDLRRRLLGPESESIGFPTPVLLCDCYYISPSHSSIPSPICPSTHQTIHLLMHLFIHPSTIHPPTHLLTHPSSLPPMHACVHPFFHPFIHPSTHA